MRNLAKYRTLMIVCLFLVLLLYGGLKVHGYVTEVHKHNQTLQERNIQLSEAIGEGKEDVARLADDVNQLQNEIEREVEKRKALQQKNDQLLGKLDAQQKRINDLSKQMAARAKAAAIQVTKRVAAAEGSTWMNFKATFYNTTGTTKSGRQTKHGVTVAVDPRIIPLGSWVELKYPDGRVEVRRADDTGSAVKGKVIDVYYKGSTTLLRQLGRQSVQVRVVSQADKV